MEKEYNLIDQIRKNYFPEAYEKQRIKNMSPEEFGEYIAEKLLEDFKRSLEMSKITLLSKINRP